MVIEIIGLFVLVVVAGFVHEFGHWYYFKRYFKRDVKFYFSWKPLKLECGNDNDYKKLKAKDLINLYTFGIVAGAIPIILCMAFIDYRCFIAFVLYSVGCAADLSKMLKAVARHQKEIRGVLENDRKR